MKLTQCIGILLRSLNVSQTQPVDIYMPSTLEDTLSKSLTFKIKASKNGIITD